jgi:dTMP kinase
MKKNLFIAFEGIDGCGKSTQTKILQERLQTAGCRIFSTCEPTAGPIGMLIRDSFNNKMKVDHRVIAGLFVADRLNHILDENDGMLAKLREGYTVITDRYYFSSYAYQGAHMPMDWVIQANSLSAGLLRPTINIFIDIAPEVSMERLKNDRTSLELYESIENLKNVRNRYFEAFKLLKNEEQVSIINGNRKLELVADEIWEKVRGMME